MKRFFACLLSVALSIFTPAYAAYYSPVGSDGAPSMGTCGTSPSVSGSDTVGTITVGTGIVTSCTLNFSTTLIWAPDCVAIANFGSILSVTVTGVTASSVTFGSSLSIGGGKIVYHCPLA